MALKDASFNVTGELTFGCWVYFSPWSSWVDMGIMGKWYYSGGTHNRAYRLRKTELNRFEVAVSSDGSAICLSDDVAANWEEEEWHYVVGRFTPGIELALFVDGKWYKNTTSIPAAIYNADQALEIGRYDSDHYLNGRACQAFICAYSVPDRFVEAMYAHTKAMFKTREFGVLAP